MDVSAEIPQLPVMDDNKSSDNGWPDQSNMVTTICASLGRRVQLMNASIYRADGNTTPQYYLQTEYVLLDCRQGGGGPLTFYHPIHGPLQRPVEATLDGRNAMLSDILRHSELWNLLPGPRVSSVSLPLGLSYLRLWLLCPGDSCPLSSNSISSEAASTSPQPND